MERGALGSTYFTWKGESQLLVLFLQHYFTQSSQNMYTGNEKTMVNVQAAKTTIGEALLGRHADFTSTYFSRTVLELLLNNPTAVGARFYTAKVEEEGEIYKTLIAVAVDADGNDLPEGGEVALGDLPCPRHCPDDDDDTIWP